MDIQKVFNANVFLDGVNNLLGKAAEFTLPEIAVELDEHKALGMIGTLQFATSLAAMTAKIKWSAFYAEAIAQGSNPFVAHNFQVRASIERYDANGRVEELPYVCLLRAKWTKNPLGTMAMGAQPEYEQELSVDFVKVTAGGVELVEIDVLNNVWKVKGVDILATYRSNLGL